VGWGRGGGVGEAGAGNAMHSTSLMVAVHIADRQVVLMSSWVVDAVFVAGMLLSACAACHAGT
jgi:hypothetical protein